MKHLIVTRFLYDDELLFSKRIRVTAQTIIPSLKIQTCQDFIWIVLAKKHHQNIIQKIYNKNILFFENKTDFMKYAVDEKFDIQTRHDSDDKMSANYIKIIQEDYKNNKKFGKPFLIHFEPSKYELSTGKIYEMANYERRNSTSAFISLCPMGSEKNILDHWHNRWVGNIDLIVRNKTKNCVLATVHDNNTSTKIKKEDKLIKIK